MVDEIIEEGSIETTTMKMNTVDNVISGIVNGTTKVIGSDKEGAMYFMADMEGMGSVAIGSTLLGSKEHGSQPTEDSSSISETTDDRSVRIRIDRTDDGCLWAFENDATIFRSIMRKEALMNNGYDIVIDKDTAQAKKAKEFIEEQLKNFRLRQKYGASIVNRDILGWAPLKKSMSDGKIVGIVELEPIDCKPIRNLSTGELGGEKGRGLDPDNKNKEVALVQQGNTVSYSSTGDPQYQSTYFYFTREEIMFFTLNERGKFKATSPVKRILRLLEAKKTLENIIEVVCRRYGPQVWVILGNEKMNFSNVKVPQKYYRAEGGNATGDQTTAIELYRKALFSTIAEKVKKWSTGETLAELAEYGVEVKVINPSANLPRYIDYIQMYADFIKNGIFGLDFPGRVDVTSSTMLDKLPRDLEDSMTLQRDTDFDILNKELINPLLKQGGFAENSVRIVGKPLNRNAIKEEVEIERLKSATVFNYMRAGLTNLPPDLVEKWGYDLPELIKIENMKTKPMTKDEQHPPIEQSKPVGQPGPIDDTSR